MDAITAAGTAVQIYKSSGAATLDVITAAGVVTLGAELASGNPTMAAITAAGTAIQIYKPSGAATLATIIAAGVATKGALTAAGNPTMDTITAAGTAVQIYKPSGAATLTTITATGEATLGAVTAAGNPSTDVITAAGTAVQIYKPSGAATLDAITAAGVATKIGFKTASGNPSTTVITASGVAASIVAGAIIPPPGRLNLVTFTGLQLFGYPPTATTSADLDVEPAVGTLALTGYPPQTDRVVEPAAGAVVLEGSAPLPVDSAGNTTIAVDEATLTFTGYITSRAYGLLLRGYAPNLVEDLPRPPAGQLELTGQLPIRIDTSPQDSLITPPVLTAALSPKHIALEFGQESLNTSLVIAGWPPVSLVASPVFQPPAGALVLTGIPIYSSIDAEPAAGAAVLAGQAPTVAVSDFRSAAPAAGALVLDGKTFEFFADTQLFQPPVAELTLTEQLAFTGRSIWSAAVARKLNTKTPIVVNTDIDYVVEPAKGTLSLAGKVPVKGQYRFVPDAYAVTISGQIPGVDLEADSIRIPSRLVLGFTSYTPSVLQGSVRAPAKGTLTLTGYLPRDKTKRIKKDAARTRFISLTAKRRIEMLYK